MMIRAFLEVRADAIREDRRFSDVNNLALGVLEEVHTGIAGEMVEFGLEFGSHRSLVIGIRKKRNLLYSPVREEAIGRLGCLVHPAENIQADHPRDLKLTPALDLATLWRAN
jgi:hypothetical protein